MCGLEWRTMCAVTRRLFGVYLPSCIATREIKTKMTFEWAHQQFVTRVHTLFYFLHDITIPQKNDKYNNVHTSTPFSLARFTGCWQLWREHVKMISNSLDIDFIRGYIYGRWCKKLSIFHFLSFFDFLRWSLKSLIVELKDLFTYIVHAMTALDLPTQGARASATMVLTCFIWNDSQ